MQFDTALAAEAPVVVPAPVHVVVPSMLDRVSVELYGVGDENAILDCVRACFECEPDVGRWRQLYRQNPAGEPIIVLARDGRDVIGHIAIVPRRIRAFGRVAIAGHQIDGMTRPSWRKRGVRKLVAEHARRHAVRRGWIATYGVTNEQSTHTALTNERRRSLGSLPLMVMPITPIAIVGALLRSAAGYEPATAGRDVVECAAAGLPPDDGRLARAAESRGVPWRAPHFDDRHTRLFHHAADIPSIAFIRDAPYLAWRYGATRPSPYVQCDVEDADGELAATAIIRVAAVGAFRVLFVLEWHWRRDAEAAAHRLAREAVALGRAVGAHGVAALAMPGTVQRRRLARLGFLPVPTALMPRTSVASVRLEQNDEDAASWVDRTSWYLTCGDGLIL